MQVMQLSMYNRNVPKLDARETAIKELGSAAIVSCDRYPVLDQKPWGSALMAESASAVASPNRFETVRQPTIAESTTSVQMARCGVRFSLWSNPIESGNSESLPM